MVSTPPSTPRSNEASSRPPGDGFRCVECGHPLVWRRLPQKLSPGLPATEPADVWEAAPQVPPGGSFTPATGGWVCAKADCRRVYPVWDAIPSFLRGEAGLLTATAHAGLFQPTAEV